MVLDESWLPPHVPSGVGLWNHHPRDEGRGFMKTRGTEAYEFVCTNDGLATEILAYVDGECTHHWRCDPIAGTWLVTYRGCRMPEMIIKKIVKDGDRTLFYGDADGFHVIGTMADADRLKVGDTIHYEPYGVNFGWLLSDAQP